MMKQIQIKADGRAHAVEMYSPDSGRLWVSANGSGNRALLAFVRRRKAALSFKFSEQEMRWIDTIDEGKRYPGRGSDDEADADSALAAHKERFMKRVGLAERKRVQQARQAAGLVAGIDGRPRVFWSERELSWKQAATPQRKLEAFRLYTEHGLMQGEIAERLQVDQATVSRWIARVERGDLKERSFSEMGAKKHTSVMLSAEEKQLLLAAAKIEGVSKTEAIRRAVRLWVARDRRPAQNEP